MRRQFRKVLLNPMIKARLKRQKKTFRFKIYLSYFISIHFITFYLYLIINLHYNFTKLNIKIIRKHIFK